MSDIIGRDTADFRCQMSYIVVLLYVRCLYITSTDRLEKKGQEGEADPSTCGKLLAYVGTGHNLLVSSFSSATEPPFQQILSEPVDISLTTRP